ncbi:hypothetical protein CHS0354_032563 [Potamilus streckersoni]|uniref:Uncharacterized protein n=1 Tax=Potamilus streckersoni TaxID=2493646 RepID=A0AAE0W0Q2_9BIVA|nr:hypothetical protein CHS0354_032563 [Potamilus streckersoni]
MDVGKQTSVVYGEHRMNGCTQEADDIFDNLEDDVNSAVDWRKITPTVVRFNQIGYQYKIRNAVHSVRKFSFPKRYPVDVVRKSEIVSKKMTEAPGGGHIINQTAFKYKIGTKDKR